MTGVDLKQALEGLDAKLTADLVISILPQGFVDLSVPEPEPVDIDLDEVPVGKDLRTLKIEFSGTLRASLERVVRRVPVEGGPGILSQTAKPTSDPIPYTVGSNLEKSGPLERRPCHYLKPEGGWRSGGRVFPTFASITPRSARALAEPVGRTWYGWPAAKTIPSARTSTSAR